jgi:hypothetical protein
MLSGLPEVWGGGRPFIPALAMDGSLLAHRSIRIYQKSKQIPEN